MTFFHLTEWLRHVLLCGKKDVIFSGVRACELKVKHDLRINILKWYADEKCLIAYRKITPKSTTENFAASQLIETVDFFSIYCWAISLSLKSVSTFYEPITIVHTILIEWKTDKVEKQSLLPHAISRGC